MYKKVPLFFYKKNEILMVYFIENEYGTSITLKYNRKTSTRKGRRGC